MYIKVKTMAKQIAIANLDSHGYQPLYIQVSDPSNGDRRQLHCPLWELRNTPQVRIYHEDVLIRMFLPICVQHDKKCTYLGTYVRTMYVQVKIIGKQYHGTSMHIYMPLHGCR